VELAHRIRLLTVDDASAWAQRRFEALTAHPLLFGAAPPRDTSRLIEFVCTQIARAESGVCGAFAAARLDGIVGVFRESGVKARHKAVIWGMYVSPEARRRGVGRALLNAAVEQARHWPGVEQVHFSVSEASGSARTLYEREGFASWGREPRAISWAGGFADETHMLLDLRAESAG